MYFLENTWECLLRALSGDGSYPEEPKTLVHMYCCGLMDESVCQCMPIAHIYVRA